MDRIIIIFHNSKNLGQNFYKIWKFLNFISIWNRDIVFLIRVLYSLSLELIFWVSETWPNVYSSYRFEIGVLWFKLVYDELHFQLIIDVIFIVREALLLIYWKYSDSILLGRVRYYSRKYLKKKRKYESLKLLIFFNIFSKKQKW